MFIKIGSSEGINSVVNCDGGGACNVGSASDCKAATQSAENQGSHNQVTQNAMSSSPGK